MYNILICRDICEHNTLTYMYTYACTRVYMHTHVCRQIHIQTYTFNCTHIHMDTYLLACTHTHLPICTHIHMYMHTHTNTVKAAVLEWNLEPARQEDYSDTIFGPPASVSPPVELVFINHWLVAFS